jgi:eukaryotic-like serine/threonine-protein kinase
MPAIDAYTNWIGNCLVSGVPDATNAAALPIAPGQVIAERYLVGEVLGEGGMGVVCAGTHILLGTPVAIKLIHSDLRDNTEAVRRFMNEARAAAALKGEHIARVFDVGQLSSGEPYLVMEQLEGTSLDHYLLDRGPLGQTEAVDIVLQACEGLAEAHAAGLVHRDIKPANLFLARLPNGQFSLKILDFGIAKQRIDSNTPALTNPGKSLGSPWYMSPEQMMTPASVDQRADVWSLGVLLFELLTTKRPFDGETVPQVCATVLTAPAPRPSGSRDDLAPELDPIVLRCLEKEPDRRFESVAELAGALQPFASAPIHGSGMVLSESETDSEQPRERHTPSYGSLTPISAGEALPAPKRSRSRWLAVAALPALALVAALAWVGKPHEPRLGATPDAAEYRASSPPPVLLQKLQTAVALREPDREREPALERSVTAEEVEMSMAQARAARVAEDQAWLRSQTPTTSPEIRPEPQPQPETPREPRQLEAPSQPEPSPPITVPDSTQPAPAPQPEPRARDNQQPSDLLPPAWPKSSGASGR